MQTLTLNAWGADHPIAFRLDHYADNRNLYVGMITWEDGWEEPWSDLTVNLDVKCAEDCAFIDTNNNGEKILLWLIQNNLGDLTGRMQPSGFCLFPEFKFNMEELMKYVG
jgi:hypothetical protein